MEEEKKLTGYPSIDKPWLKYYSKEAIEAPLPEMTMYQYIWENNKDYLDDVALRYYGTKITYGKLFENIKKAASAFYSMGIRKGDIVTIMSMHTPECIYAIYGLNYIGAIANMVYMTLSEKEIIDTIENTESKLLLVLDPVLDKIRSIKEKIDIPIVVLGVSDSMPLYMKIGYKLKTKTGKHPFLTYSQFLSKGTAEPLMSDDHASPAVIVYTSGTTGEPKGVVLGNDALNNLAFQDRNGLIDFRRKEDCFLILPPFIAFGVAHTHLLLYSGVVQILQINLDPNDIFKNLFKCNPYCFVSGPAFIEPMLNYPKGNLDHLRYFFGGGGAITSEQKANINKYLKDCGSTAFYANGYGMTEASSVLSINLNSSEKQGSIGIPILKTSIKVVDDNDIELPYNEIGELLFLTPSLMDGYYKNEEGTKEVLFTDKDGLVWLRTGDLGYVDEDGFIYIKGRIKRIYITRGEDGTAYKLFPQRIEETIEKNNTEVEKCAVIVKEDPEKMHIALAYVSLKDEYKKLNTNDLTDKIRKGLEADLPDHMQPREIVIIEQMPITPSGKIDYRALESLGKGKYKCQNRVTKRTSEMI